MVPYKAVFIDLDGTLLNKQSIVSARNAATLKKLVDRDIRVVFATGRPIESVRNLVGKIHDKDPAITLSGSMIHASVYGEPMMAHTIPFDTFQQILAACEAMGTVDNILVDDADGFYVLKHSKEMEEFVGMFNAEPQLFTYDAIPTSPILSLMIHSKEHRRAIYTALQEKFSDAVHFTFFKEYPWIELSNFSSNKGNSMQFVCERLGIDISETIAIGDGANDLEMIAAAGLGIAMMNADDEVKAVADRIAPHHADDGFAQVMEEIFGF